MLNQKWEGIPWRVSCRFVHLRRFYVHNMKKLIKWVLPLLVLGIGFQACDDSETYADLKKKERKNIQAFIKERGIKVITESEFYAQDSTTNVSKNEYVLFNDNGVYMQIENKGGSGEKLQEDEWKEILVRFWEIYVESGDTSSVSNKLERYPDVMSCKNVSGTYYATFTSGTMYSNYGTSVPEGWLVPLNFINLGRDQSQLAKVKLIVPHAAGHSDASSSVYPMYYEISYQVGR